ncbi:MAG: hypothetical protein UX60_C0019G0003 [Berkelbacteria bacterium GW2011_GWA2_46_7]|uniref:Antitoxin n=1 Tax=Berkelbacteria bacterium GW2011_GWA2_46_7 TaxID=1618335 RepID=A0A0G1QFE9_9BACT|nr:MAG: hypothetical protein UX60_C0019G0003 [Berkelbacteria bacterium GW2011_GWA2_46_7]
MPLTDARDNFSRLISDIENLTEGLYVLTKGGKPAIALINIKYLEEIMVGNGAETSHEATHHVSTPHHVAPKPHVSLKPVENAKPEPIVHDLPKPPAVILPDIEPPKPPLPPKPSFEVPRTTPTISNTQTPMESKSPSNYDVSASWRRIPSRQPTADSHKPCASSFA